MMTKLNRSAWLGIFLIALISGDAFAERYLTIPEAQKICFPKANNFETQAIELSKNQIKKVEKKSGAKFLSKTNAYSIAWQEKTFLGMLIFDRVLGKHEMIDYAVAISPEGKILQVEILEYREHYGGEIRRDQWRGQFKGKNLTSPLKIHEDIYNISGATISCRHVTEGVKRVLATYDLVIRPQLVASGKLPNDAAKP
ncbi:MAG: FMN-binding protein [Verrucomicrobiota bacterium]